MKNIIISWIIVLVLLFSIKSSAQQKNIVNYSFLENNVVKSAESNIQISMYLGKSVVGVAKSNGKIIRSNYLYKITTKNVTDIGKENNSVVPTSYSLDQNYPNPFNPVTRIRYSIPKESFVSIAVYNLLGEKVEDLVSGIKSPGSYTVDWNAKDFTSGIYIYCIRSAGFTDSKKLILLK